jgi:FtsP/CotA-like multicopper oxidase with cupredoxin domain
MSAGLARPGGGIAGLAGLAAQGPAIKLPKIHELKSENGLRTVELFARPLVEGGNALGYALCTDRNDPACAPLIPGPTIRLFRGDRLRLRLVNELGVVTTNLHVHGLHVTPRATSDNIFVHVHPGQDFAYEYQIPMFHRSGLFWYHPHFHGSARTQVEGGLAGAIIIDERDDDPPEFLDEPDAVKGASERLLVFQRLVALGGEIAVNGVQTPEIRFNPGTWERWRILNASSQTYINLYLEGVDFYRVADDGNWLEQPVKSPVVPVGPAERAEVLVYLEPRPSYQLTNLTAGGGPGLRVPIFTHEMSTSSEPLATVVPEPPAEAAVPTAVPAAPPTTLLPLRDLRAVPDVPERVIRLQFDPPPPPFGFTINDKYFQHGRIDQTVELTGVEEWTIRSETDASHGWHPLHIHVNDFQVKEIKLAAPDPVLDPLLKKLFEPVFFTDTVPVPIGGEVKIRAEFLHFTGKFVYHCHFLDHEDNSMMGVIDVARPIKIEGAAFSEPTVTVHAGPDVAALVNSGTTVVWTNRDEHEHTITADAVDLLNARSIFASGSLAKGRSFTHTFDAPDSVTYRCSCAEHADSVGTIVVTADQPVDIRDSVFLPASVRVAVGTTVTWTNRDAAPRTVTIHAVGAGETPVFTTGELGQSASASHTFTEAGDYAYGPGLETAIVVRPVTRQSVSIGILDFEPELPVLAVFRDSTVTWINRSGDPVSIAVPGEDSGVLDPEETIPPAKALSPGQRFGHTFSTGGPVDYVITRHVDGMPTVTRSIAVVEPVELVNFGAFAVEPAVATIPVGAEVGWINRDVVAHTVTANDLDFATGEPVFDTGPIAPGAVSRLAFPTAGEFPYRCITHPDESAVEGTIVVEAPLAPEEVASF